jgi:hypothetical protein
VLAFIIDADPRSHRPKRTISYQHFRGNLLARDCRSNHLPKIALSQQFKNAAIYLPAVSILAHRIGVLDEFWLCRLISQRSPLARNGPSGDRTAAGSNPEKLHELLGVSSN